MSGIILTENQATSIIQCFIDHYRRNVISINLFDYLRRRDMEFTSLTNEDEDVTSFVIEIKRLPDDIHIPFVLFYHFNRPSIHVNDEALTGWSHKAFVDDLIDLLKAFGLLKGESDNADRI